MRFVAPYGRSAGSSRVRMFHWIKRIGLEPPIYDFLSESDASPRRILTHPIRTIEAHIALHRLRKTPTSLLFLHREGSPLSDGRLEATLLQEADFGVYDFDDALHLQSEVGVRRLRPKAAKLLHAFRSADRIIAGSPMLADFASSYAPDVHLIPSCVEPKMYVAKTDYDLADPPRIGWIGSASQEEHLQLIGPALRELNRRTGSRLQIIGQLDRKLGEIETFIDRFPWSEDIAGAIGPAWDIGIMPLRDAPYERGKCGYKLLQYGSMRLPFVGSPVGVNKDILAKAQLPQPKTCDEWLSAIQFVFEMSAAERARLGGGALRLVQAEYSYDSWEPAWRHALGLPAFGNA